VILCAAAVIVSVVLHRKADTDKEELLRALRYPLYGLFHMDSIEQSSTGGYLYDIVPGFRENYKPRLQSEIMEAMELAISDPHMDF
jgi:hypothetical protein